MNTYKVYISWNFRNESIGRIKGEYKTLSEAMDVMTTFIKMVVEEHINPDDEAAMATIDIDEWIFGPGIYRVHDGRTNRYFGEVFICN